MPLIFSSLCAPASLREIVYFFTASQLLGIRATSGAYAQELPSPPVTGLRGETEGSQSRFIFRPAQRAQCI
jgi:hypothetical protein